MTRGLTCTGQKFDDEVVVMGERVWHAAKNLPGNQPTTIQRIATYVLLYARTFSHFLKLNYILLWNVELINPTFFLVQEKG